jgi:hypothetical protein
VGRDRRLAGGENGGHYGGLPRRLVTWEQIHAAAEPDEPAGGHRPFPCAAAEPDRFGLGCRQQTELPASEGVDPVVQGVSHVTQFRPGVCRSVLFFQFYIL